MEFLFRGRAKEAGLPPGSVVYTGDAPSEPVVLSRMNYSETACDEKQNVSIADCSGLHDKTEVTPL
jgi:hypothetical protein